MADDRESLMKSLNTAIRHIQGLIKVKAELERERDNLLAEHNAGRNRGEVDESQQDGL